MTWSEPGVCFVINLLSWILQTSRDLPINLLRPLNPRMTPHQLLCPPFCLFYYLSVSFCVSVLLSLSLCSPTPWLYFTQHLALGVLFLTLSMPPTHLVCRSKSVCLYVSHTPRMSLSVSLTCVCLPSLRSPYKPSIFSTPSESGINSLHWQSTCSWGYYTTVVRRSTIVFERRGRAATKTTSPLKSREEDREDVSVGCFSSIHYCRLLHIRLASS